MHDICTIAVTKTWCPMLEAIGYCDAGLQYMNGCKTITDPTMLLYFDENSLTTIDDKTIDNITDNYTAYLGLSSL